MHEAAVNDPTTGIVYMTEDNGPGRLAPTAMSRRTVDDLQAGGTLQILAIKGKPRYDTRTGQTPGTDLRRRMGDDR